MCSSCRPRSHFRRASLLLYLCPLIASYCSFLFLLLRLMVFFFFFFFFQAEDGIRDTSVTGVQTCALPISKIIITPKKAVLDPQGKTVQNALTQMGYAGVGAVHVGKYLEIELDGTDKETRSEERRVGKSVDLGGSRVIKKKRKE